MDLVATVAVFVRPSVDPKATAAEKGGVTVLSGLRMYLQRTTTVASNQVDSLALPHCLGMPYWLYQLVLSWYLHQP